MTEQQKLKIIQALETLSKETDVEAKEIIDLLTGFCWDEEDGGRFEEWIARRV